MIAESLLRIIEKRRATAVQMGTFFVELVPRAGSRAAKQISAVHDRVLRPLLSDARECRVYGISKKSPLRAIVSELGRSDSRVWRLDTRRELVEGFEDLWNAKCEHNGIAIVVPFSSPQIERALAACGKPDVWASRNQIFTGTSRKAVAHCFDAVASDDVCAFLIPGSNGLEWLDVFAREPRIAELWDKKIEHLRGRDQSTSS